MRLIGWTADENGLIIAESEKTSGLPPETVLKGRGRNRDSVGDLSSKERLLL
ncbi:MAG: hypothetical protein IPK98_19585 [Chloracidobacterium sp.]|nr:hypothetical protein [Chloracidobacterium sp.]